LLFNALKFFFDGNTRTERLLMSRIAVASGTHAVNIPAVPGAARLAVITGRVAVLLNRDGYSSDPR
jgi:hypothetical protein